MEKENEKHWHQSTQRMQERIDAHMRELPAGFLKDSTEATHQISNMNASAQVKLNKLFALVDGYAQMRSSYVACKSGCDACCHMNVQITNVEASRIEKATGKKAMVLSRDKFHDRDKFAGVPCPFLKDKRCSIYADRPLSCRSHASFDQDAFWCEPERMNEVDLPQVQITDVHDAVEHIISLTRQARIADIRDFYPA